MQRTIKGITYPSHHTTSNLARKTEITQNINDSFTVLIWNNVPITVFCSIKMVEIGTFVEAVLLFNKGQKSIVDVLKNPCIVARKSFVSYLNAEDTARMARREKWVLNSTKEARNAKRMSRWSSRQG